MHASALATAALAVRLTGRPPLPGLLRFTKSLCQRIRPWPDGAVSLVGQTLLPGSAVRIF